MSQYMSYTGGFKLKVVEPMRTVDAHRNRAAERHFSVDRLRVCYERKRDVFVR